MNIHPIFVHFPIALFTLYAVCELIRSKKLLQNVSWWWFKFGLLFFGTLASFAALETGSIAEDLHGHSALIGVHSDFASYSVTLFSVLAVLYIVDGISRGILFPSITLFLQKYSLTRAIWKLLLKLKKLIIDSGLVSVLAFAGLILITITGALGGAIVYGPNADPVVNFIYHLFF